MTTQQDGPLRDEITIEVNKMDGKDFTGTITPTEARITIFEDVLGFTQADLAGITLGYNRGRTVTFKLRQQFDIDDLYEWEYFNFERSVGRDVSSISCRIRGVRDPSTRMDRQPRIARPNQAQAAAQIDDGTRIVKIIGCEYKLSESEILDWLVQFGEVISDITEEIFDNPDVQGHADMPPVGNGTYIVTMKLKKDMPNWVPMYGRKVSFVYRGIQKQCSSCFGPHIKKFCKNERMSLAEYAERFRVKNPTIPEHLYGSLAKIENLAPKVTSNSSDQPEQQLLLSWSWAVV